MTTLLGHQHKWMWESLHLLASSAENARMCNEKKIILERLQLCWKGDIYNTAGGHALKLNDGIIISVRLLQNGPRLCAMYVVGKDRKLVWSTSFEESYTFINRVKMEMKQHKIKLYQANAFALLEQVINTSSLLKTAINPIGQPTGVDTDVSCLCDLNGKTIVLVVNPDTTLLDTLQLSIRINNKNIIKARNENLDTFLLRIYAIK